MVTILSRYLLPIGLVILAVFLLLVGAYNKGYVAADNTCKKEKLELIIKKEVEKDAILAKIREKSPQERRKALSKYVYK